MGRRFKKKEKKPRFFNKKNLLGLFIVAIMVLSGIGYMWGSDSSNSVNTYNKHKFTYMNNKWFTKINDDYVGFSTYPKDVEQINMSKDASDYLKNIKMLYISFDPNSELVSDFEVARIQLENELPQYFNIFPSIGVTEESNQYEYFPTITCDNSSIYIPVLVFRQGNETKIIEDGTCIIFQAQYKNDVSALKDRLMYNLFGIIQ